MLHWSLVTIFCLLEISNHFSSKQGSHKFQITPHKPISPGFSEILLHEEKHLINSSTIYGRLVKMKVTTCKHELIWIYYWHFEYIIMNIYKYEIFFKEIYYHRHWEVRRLHPSSLDKVIILWFVEICIWLIQIDKIIISHDKRLH